MTVRAPQTPSPFSEIVPKRQVAQPNIEGALDRPLSQVLDVIDQQKAAAERFAPDAQTRQAISASMTAQKGRFGLIHALRSQSQDSGLMRSAASLMPENIRSEEQVFQFLAFQLRSRLQGREFALLTDHDKELRTELASGVMRFGAGLDESRRAHLRQIALGALDFATVTPSEAEEQGPEFQERYNEVRARLKAQAIERDSPLWAATAKTTIPFVRAFTEAAEGILDLIPGVEIREGKFLDVAADFVSMISSAFSGKPPDETRLLNRAIARIGKPTSPDDAEFDFITEASGLLGTVGSFVAAGGVVNAAGRGIGAAFGLRGTRLASALAKNNRGSTFVTGFLFGAGAERGQPLSERAGAGLVEAVKLSALVAMGHWAAKLPASLRNGPLAQSVAGERAIQSMESIVSAAPFMAADPRFREHISNGEFAKAALIASPTIGVFGAMGALANPAKRRAKVAAEKENARRRARDHSRAEQDPYHILDSELTRVGLEDIDVALYRQGMYDRLKEFSAGNIPAERIGTSLREDYQRSRALEERDWDPLDKKIFDDLGHSIDLTFNKATRPQDIGVEDPLAYFNRQAKETLKQQGRLADTFDAWFLEALGRAETRKIERLKEDAKLQEQKKNALSGLSTTRFGHDAFADQLGLPDARLWDRKDMTRVSKVVDFLNEHGLEIGIDTIPDLRAQELVRTGYRIQDVAEKLKLPKKSMAVEIADRLRGRKLESLELSDAKRATDWMLASTAAEARRSGKLDRLRSEIEKMDLPGRDRQDMLDFIDQVAVRPEGDPDRARAFLGGSQDPNRLLTEGELRQLSLEINARLNRGEATVLLQQIQGSPLTVGLANRIYRDLSLRREIRTVEDFAESERRAMELLSGMARHDMKAEVYDSLLLQVEEMAPNSERLQRRINEASIQRNPEALKRLVEEVYLNPLIRPPERVRVSMLEGLEPLRRRDIDSRILEEMAVRAETEGGSLSRLDREAIEIQAGRQGLELKASEMPSSAREFIQWLNDKMRSEFRTKLLPARTLTEPPRQEKPPLRPDIDITQLEGFQKEFERELREVRQEQARIRFSRQEAGQKQTLKLSELGKILAERPEPGEPAGQGVVSSKFTETEIAQLGTRLVNFKATRPQDKAVISEAAERLGFIESNLPFEQRLEVGSTLEVRKLLSEQIAGDSQARAALTPRALRVLGRGTTQFSQPQITEVFLRLTEGQKLSGEQALRIAEIAQDMEPMLSGRTSSSTILADSEIRSILNEGSKNKYPDSLPVFRPESSEIINKRLDRPAEFEQAMQRMVASEIAARVAERRGAQGLADELRIVRDEIRADLQANMAAVKKTIGSRIKVAGELFTEAQGKYIESVTYHASEKPKKIVSSAKDIDRLFDADGNFALRETAQGEGWQARYGVEESGTFIEISGEGDRRIRIRDRSMEPETIREIVEQAGEGHLPPFRVDQEFFQTFLRFREVESREVPFKIEKPVETNFTEVDLKLDTEARRRGEPDATDVCGCFHLWPKQDRPHRTILEKNLMDWDAQLHRSTHDRPKGPGILRRHIDPVGALKGTEVEGLVYAKDPGTIFRLIGDNESGGGIGTGLMDRLDTITRKMRTSIVGQIDRLMNPKTGALRNIKEGGDRSRLLYLIGELDSVRAAELVKKMNDPGFAQAARIYRQVLQQARQDIQDSISFQLKAGRMSAAEAKSLRTSIEDGTFGFFEQYMPRFAELDPAAARYAAGNDALYRGSLEMDPSIFRSNRWDPTRVPEGKKPDAIFPRELEDGNHFKRDAVFAIRNYLGNVYRWIQKREVGIEIEAHLFGRRDFLLGRSVPDVDLVKQGDFLYRPGKNLDEKSRTERETHQVVRNDVNAKQLIVRKIGSDRLETIAYEDLLGKGRKWGVRSIGLAEFGLGPLAATPRGLPGARLIDPQAVADVSKRPQFDGAIQAIETWMKDVFGPQKETAWTKLSGFLAGIQYHNLLGFLNPKAAATNFTQILNSVGQLGPRWVGGGLKEALTPEGKALLAKNGVLLEMPSVTEMARLSPEQIVEKMYGKGFRGKAEKVSFALWDMTESLTRGATWLAAYRKALASKVTELDAVRYAHQVVGDTMFHYDRLHSPQILRSRGLRAITTLTTFTHRSLSNLIKSFDFLGRIQDPKVRAAQRRNYLGKMITWGASAYVAKQLSRIAFGDDHQINLMTSIGTDVENIPFVGRYLDVALTDLGIAPGELPRTIPVQSAGLGPSPAIEALSDFVSSAATAIRSGTPQAIEEAFRRRRRLLLGRTATSVYEALQVSELMLAQGLAQGGATVHQPETTLFADRLVTLPGDAEKPFGRYVSGRLTDTFDTKDFFLDLLLPGSVVNRRRRWDVLRKIDLAEERQNSLRERQWDLFARYLMSKEPEDLVEAQDFLAENAGAMKLESYDDLRRWFERNLDLQLRPPAVRALLTRRDLDERISDLAPGGAAELIAETEPTMALSVLDSVAKTEAELKDRVKRGEVSRENAQRWIEIRRSLLTRLRE